MDRKRTLPLPSFAKFTGDQFSLSSAAQGHSVPDAQDLTQEFFGKVIKGRLIQSADRNKGRFRSLLLKAVATFLARSKAISVRRANVAVTYALFPGTTG